MVRHSLAFAAFAVMLSFCVRAPAKDYLDAALAADAATYVGEVVFYRPPPWQGYPRGEGLGFSGDEYGTSAAREADRACAVSGAAATVKALLSTNPANAAPSQEDIIRTLHRTDNGNPSILFLTPEQMQGAGAATGSCLTVTPQNQLLH